MRNFFLGDPDELSLLTYVEQFAAGNDPAKRTLYRIRGGNDRLAERIAGIRTVLRARRVIWLLPYHRGAAAIVTRIAIRFRDDRLDLAAIATRDGVHPDYRALADALVD